MLTKSKLLAVGLLLAVAGAGFASGHATATWRNGADCGRGRERWSFSGMLQDSLGLTDAQRDSVRALLTRHRSGMRAIFETVRPQMDSVRSLINDEIAATLTPEQRRRFAELRERWRTERTNHGDSGRGGRRSL